MTSTVTQPFDPATLDFDPLAEPVSADDLRSSRQRGAPPAPTAERVNFVFIFVASLAAIAVLTAFSLYAFVKLLTASDRPEDQGWIVGLIVLGGLTHYTLANFIRWYRGVRNSPRRTVRLGRFAARNALVHVPRTADPVFAGNVFQRGRTRISTNRLRTADEPIVELGNHRYTDFTEVTKRERSWTYIAIQMDRHLPNIVVHARANRRRGGIPGEYTKQQVVSLEGDFNRYFTLRAPRSYETDALYIFTPDVMALLIDNVAAFDIEIVDDWVFICTPAFLPLDSPATLTRLGAIVTAIRPKVQKQTARYRDDRVGSFAANRVAPAGARLQQAVIITGSFGFAGIGLVVGLLRLVPQLIGG